MRLHSLRLRGITEAFPNEVCVDFDSLGEGLIAIVGENGAGKSTLIGSVFAALFRQLPGQKRSLYDFATHPQPEIDLTFSVNGARYRSLLKIDPKSRQMESYLFNGEGKPLTNGKKEPFEELVRKCAGTPDFFLSSIFSSQKRTGNFLSLDRSERKELFIRELLGLDRLRLIAAAAKDKGDEVASLIARQAQIKQRQEQMEMSRTRLAQVEAELGAARTEQEDYNYLARVFGPDEIQLCEIQAAGPQVSILVNSLLEGCFDNKFEIRFRTQRPKADGQGMVDDFDVEVRNKNLDRTCLVDELSGGQFVLVNEAVNLGIAIYNMRQGEGICYETLFRDETVGALDAANGKEYVRMLRRAMDLGGFHQVIFICHTPTRLGAGGQYPFSSWRLCGDWRPGSGYPNW